MVLFFGILFALQAIFGAASPVISRGGAPTVNLDKATVTGTSSGGVEKFLGIPFASPP
jgi:hypothetical protein